MELPLNSFQGIGRCVEKEAENRSIRAGRLAAAFAAIVAAVIPSCSNGETADASPEISREPTECLCSGWEDHPASPLIEPPPPEPIIADPTVVLPADSPDGQWHLFAHSLLGIRHFVSDDGIAWEGGGRPLFAGARPYVYLEGGHYYLLYELFRDLTLSRSTIQARMSENLEDWSGPTEILAPSLSWESDPLSTNGNPFLMKVGNEYWLYYSANGVFQPDTGFAEPKYIGLARASSVLGPYRKNAEPLIGPSTDDPYRNQSAGSLKLFGETWLGRWIAFNNGIFVDAGGRSRSAVRPLISEDGENWRSFCDAPIVSPEGAGWKAAFVYAFDVKRVKNQLWMYYNARDGWVVGTERIGLAIRNVQGRLSDLPDCSK